MPFVERNMNFGKPYSDVEVGLGWGALPAAFVDSSWAAPWRWPRSTVEAGTTRPATNNGVQPTHAIFAIIETWKYIPDYTISHQGGWRKTWVKVLLRESWRWSVIMPCNFSFGHKSALNARGTVSLNLNKQSKKFMVTEIWLYWMLRTISSLFYTFWVTPITSKGFYEVQILQCRIWNWCRKNGCRGRIMKYAN